MKKAEPKPDIHFRLTAGDYRFLQQVAERMDRSMSYLIEKIIKEWIEAAKKEPPLENKEQEK